MKIIPYHPVYQAALPEISLAWLRHYNILEDLDVEMVTHPEWILDGGGHILLAVSEKTADAGSPAKAVLGMVMLENNGDSGEILKLGVRENARRQGIARQLMEQLIEIAKKEGKHKLTLSSNHQLTAALRLYESMGFTYTTCDQPHFALSDIYMELLLTP